MRSNWNQERLEVFIDEMEKNVPRWKVVAWSTIFAVAVFLLFWFDFEKTAPIALGPMFVVGTLLGRYGARREFVAKLEKDCADVN